jgi:hypothetical protein
MIQLTQTYVGGYNLLLAMCFELNNPKRLKNVIEESCF